MPNDTSALPNDIRESLAIANAKSVAEQPAMLSNLAFANLITNNNLSQQNTVSNQQSMNELGITVTAKAINRVSNLSSEEAVATLKINSGNELAEQIAELKAIMKQWCPPNMTPGPVIPGH